MTEALLGCVKYSQLEKVIRAVVDRVKMEIQTKSFLNVSEFLPAYVCMFVTSKTQKHGFG